MAVKKPDLTEVVSHLLDECRVVLPGIQALFGFQLIAVFNQRFTQIPFGHQVTHLCATGLVALAAGLVMTPAAYHRTVEPQGVSERFVRVSTRLLLLSMVFLAAGVSLDFFVISSMVLDSPTLCTLLGCALFAALAGLWFVFPHWRSAPPVGESATSRGRSGGS